MSMTAEAREVEVAALRERARALNSDAADARSRAKDLEREADDLEGEAEDVLEEADRLAANIDLEPGMVVWFDRVRRTVAEVNQEAEAWRCVEDDEWHDHADVEHICESVRRAVAA